MSLPEVEAVGADEEFAEGRIITALHKRRERNPALRRKLLGTRRKIGPLECDVCAFVPQVSEPELAEAA